MSVTAPRTLETKVVMLGHSGVGKTSMLNQFVRGNAPPHSTATIGAAFMKKTIQLDGWHIIMQIWDTAGQERFRSMAPMYYRGAHAAVLVFDVTSAETLDKVGEWADELHGHASDDILLVLAANKADLLPPQQQQPPTKQNGSAAPSADYDALTNGGSGANSIQAAAAAYAASIHAAYYQTNAMTGEGIEPLFTHVARRLLQAAQAKERDGRREERSRQIGLQEQFDQSGQTGCC
ncbi:hypothetical protein MMC34_008643 [Xylographa carneopallida]|nr:hypothetical protein [Xylographa carneopallida]